MIIALLIWGIILWIVNIVMCGWLASQKRRNIVTWCVLGFLFPIITIIAIAGANAEFW